MKSKVLAKKLNEEVLPALPRGIPHWSSAFSMELSMFEDLNGQVGFTASVRYTGKLAQPDMAGFARAWAKLVREELMAVNGVSKVEYTLSLPWTLPFLSFTLTPC